MQTYNDYDREKIMSLEPLELYDYVNRMLEGGYTFEKLCGDKGLRNKTIRARLQKCNASYNQKMRRYVIEGGEGHATTTATLQPRYNHSATTSDPGSVRVMVVSEKEVEATTKAPQKNTTKGVLANEDIKTIEALRQAIADLTEQVTTLNNSGKLVEPVSNAVGINPPVPTIGSEKLKVRHFESVPIARSQKFYPESLQAIADIKAQYPEYSIQLILNTLILEGADSLKR